MRKTIPQFLRYLATERNASDLTIKAYREDLMGLVEWLESTCGSVPSPNELSPQTLRGFQAALQEAGYARTTIARKLASLRSFYKFAQRLGVAQTNPAKPLRTHVVSESCRMCFQVTKWAGCSPLQAVATLQDCVTVRSSKRCTVLVCV